MATGTRNAVARAVRAVASDATDRDLLGRFAAGDEAAFAALVARHGGMVQGVCRRVLPTVQDAEDATQAVFLVLAKQAAGGRWQPSIANWLYTTARRVAAKANRGTKRRTKREQRPVPPTSPSALDQMSGREAFAALDAELDRLPPGYREPLVLCHLQGLTRDEAAARLGVPTGTLKTRLERGRKRLADALTKRGIVLGAALLAASATSPAGASSPALIESVLAGVSGSPSPAAAALARGATMTGLLTRTKLLAVVGLVAVGFGLAGVAADPPQMDKPKADVKAEPKTAATERTITGTVLGPDGKAIRAELHLIRIDGKTDPLGKTNADGTFRVTLPVRRSEAWLVAKADGHGLDFLTPWGNTPADVTLRLPKDSPVRGRVLDPEGKPVVGGTVYLVRVDDYGNTGLSLFLGHWKKRDPEEAMLGGEKAFVADPRSGFELADGRVMPTATTDKDGRFELRGLGGERVVQLLVRGPGIADTEVTVVNRPGFDPTEANKASADAHARLPSSLRGIRLQVLYGPEPKVVAEPEKPVRGVVFDHETKKPRAGVKVWVADRSAVTDAAGKFVVRGCRKQEGYAPHVSADTETGYLPCSTEVKDTAGYEPIDVEVPCVKGVVLSGVMTDKSTGKPVAGIVSADVLKDNPVWTAHPQAARGGPVQTGTRTDGSFRLVVPPGPVLLMAGLQVSQEEFKYLPPVPDPKHPTYFDTEIGSLSYVTPNGSYTPVRGCWVQVIDLAGTEKSATRNIELVRDTRKGVKTTDADGKPLKGCEAAGIVARGNYPTGEGGEEVGVYGLGANESRLMVACQQTRKLIGYLKVTADDKDPVLVLKPGGTVTGRLVGADGKPLIGVTVGLTHAEYKAKSVFDMLHYADPVTTDADGKFRIDHVVPGFEFRLSFNKGAKVLGAPGGPHTVSKPGDSKDLGNVILAPADGGKE